MEYFESEELLEEAFSSNDIEIFYGHPGRSANTDFCIHGIESVVDYCVLNEINEVFFDCRYAEQSQDWAPRLKEELQARYKSYVSLHTVGFYKLAHVEESFYEPVLASILAQLDQELAALEEAPQGTEDQIEYIHVWVLNRGLRLYTSVKIGNEDETQEAPPSKQMHRKYMELLNGTLEKRYGEASALNKRIEQEKQQAVLDRIALQVRHDPLLLTLKTVKARNDYADRICVKWQSEPGYGWLTKKAVRAVVESSYAEGNM